MLSTSTKTIAVNVRSSQAYIKSLSKRSLFLAILFTGIVVFCFILSLGPTRPWYLSQDHEGYLSYARNDTHLISNNKFTSCQGRCPTPPGIKTLKPKQIFEACLDKGKLAEYYMTIVIVSRNDNYGDFQYQRFQNMLDSTFLMAEDTKTSLELLIIEWNPEKDKRSIRDVYRFRRSDYLTYRILTVPREVHDTFQYKNPKPVYEFEGKNLGVKHARGEFIVCTNQDDIWSNNMYQAIRSRSWQKDMIYTQFQDKHSQGGNSTTLIQLSDFPTDHEIQASCTSNMNDISMMLPLMNDTLETPFVLPKEETRLDRENYLRIGHEASDFTLAHQDVWMSVGGYREIGATIWMDVEFLLTAFHTKGIPITYSPEPFTCHQIHRHVVHEGAEFDNKDVQVDGIISKQISYANTGHWGLSQIVDLFQSGLNCDVFRGGLGK